MCVCVCVCVRQCHTQTNSMRPCCHDNPRPHIWTQTMPPETTCAIATAYNRGNIPPTCISTPKRRTRRVTSKVNPTLLATRASTKRKHNEKSVNVTCFFCKLTNQCQYHTHTPEWHIFTRHPSLSYRVALHLTSEPHLLLICQPAPPVSSKHPPQHHRPPPMVRSSNLFLPL